MTSTSLLDDESYNFFTKLKQKKLRYRLATPIGPSTSGMQARTTPTLMAITNFKVTSMLTSRYFAAFSIFMAAACGQSPNVRPGVTASFDFMDSQSKLRTNIVGGWQDSGHPSVGILRSSTGLCTGTLISSHGVLTAAHCINGGNLTFEVGGATVAATRAVAHPGYCGGNCNDMAVVLLSSAPSVKPSPVYEQAPQFGQVLTLVG